MTSKQTSPTANPFQSSLVAVVSTTPFGYVAALSLSSYNVNVTLLDITPPTTSATSTPSTSRTKLPIPAASPKTSSSSVLPNNSNQQRQKPITIRPKEQKRLPDSIIRATSPCSSKLHLVKHDGHVQLIESGVENGSVIDQSMFRTGLQSMVTQNKHIVHVKISELSDIDFKADGWVKLTFITAEGATRSMRSRLLIASDEGNTLLKCQQHKSKEFIEIVGDEHPKLKGIPKTTTLQREMFIKVDAKLANEACNKITKNEDESIAFCSHRDAGVSLIAGPMVKLKNGRSERTCKLRANESNELWTCETVEQFNQFIHTHIPLKLIPENLIPNTSVREFLLSNIQQSSQSSVTRPTTTILGAKIGTNNENDNSKQGAIAFVWNMSDALSIIPSTKRSPFETIQSFVNSRLSDAITELAISKKVERIATTDFNRHSLFSHHGFRRMLSNLSPGLFGDVPLYKAIGEVNHDEAKDFEKDRVAGMVINGIKTVGAAVPALVVAGLVGGSRDDDDSDDDGDDDRW